MCTKFHHNKTELGLTDPPFLSGIHSSDTYFNLDHEISGTCLEMPKIKIVKLSWLCPGFVSLVPSTVIYLRLVLSNFAFLPSFWCLASFERNKKKCTDPFQQLHFCSHTSSTQKPMPKATCFLWFSKNSVICNMLQNWKFVTELFRSAQFLGSLMRSGPTFIALHHSFSWVTTVTSGTWENGFKLLQPCMTCPSGLTSTNLP